MKSRWTPVIVAAVLVAVLVVHWTAGPTRIAHPRLDDASIVRLAIARLKADDVKEELLPPQLRGSWHSKHYFYHLGASWHVVRPPLALLRDVPAKEQYAVVWCGNGWSSGVVVDPYQPGAGPVELGSSNGLRTWRERGDGSPRDVTSASVDGRGVVCRATQRGRAYDAIDERGVQWGRSGCGSADLGRVPLDTLQGVAALPQSDLTTPEPAQHVRLLQRASGRVLLDADLDRSAGMPLTDRLVLLPGDVADLRVEARGCWIVWLAAQNPLRQGSRYALDRWQLYLPEHVPGVEYHSGAAMIRGCGNRRLPAPPPQSSGLWAIPDRSDGLHRDPASRIRVRRSAKTWLDLYFDSSGQSVDTGGEPSVDVSAPLTQPFSRAALSVQSDGCWLLINGRND